MNEFIVPTEPQWDGKLTNYQTEATETTPDSKFTKNKKTVLSNLDYMSYYRHELPSLRVGNNSAEARAKCPFHDDNTASLSVEIDTGKYFCHACNEGGDVFKFAMKKHDVSFPEALAILDHSKHKDMPHGKAEDYVYRDALGNHLYTVVKGYNQDGKKTFHQGRPDGNGGLIPNLHGVEQTLFNLPEVLKSSVVYLTEGEKDACRLQELGFIASCNPGGAGKWKDKYSNYLKGKRVVIFEDNDTPGKKHAQMIAQSLAGIAQEVRIVSFDELPLKNDISDWLDKGHTKQELTERIERTSIWTPSIDAPVTAEIDWDFITGGQLLDVEFKHSSLIEGLLGEKESLLIVGGSGIGKSLMTNDVALTAGSRDNRNLWGRFPIPNQMKTLFIQAENSDHAVQDRLKTMCTGNPSLEAVVRDSIILPKVGGTCRIQGNLNDKQFIQNIIQIIKASGVQLIIVDPLISYAGADENDNTGMREALDNLDRLMDETNTSVVLIHHVAKAKTRGVQGGRGAQAISDWAANIIKLDPEKGYEDGSRLIIHHQKARNFAIKTPKFTLQRTANLLYMPAEDIVNEAELAKAKSVVDKLMNLGGSIDKQRSFVDALVADSTASSETVAQTMINDAVKAKHIIVVPGPGKAKGYRLPENTTIEQVPKLADAA